MSQVVDFEMFRKSLEDVFENKAKKNKVGTYDVVMMFKVMVIKHYYNLSDHQVQYQITDRQSFKDFTRKSNKKDVEKNIEIEII